MKLHPHAGWKYSGLQFSKNVPLRILMVLMLILVCGGYLLALAVLVIEMVTAPVGYQDERGFHCGEEPGCPLDQESTKELEPELAPSDGGR